MAVTGPKITRRTAIWAPSSILFAALLKGQSADNETLTQINYVCSALTAGNASDAMTPFARSFSNYAKLQNLFEGLTSAFDLTNEVNLVDEERSDNEIRATLDWTLTMASRNTGLSHRRSGELHVRLIRDGKKWKIADLSPISFFNAQASNP